MNSPKVNYVVFDNGTVRTTEGKLLALWQKEFNIIHLAIGGIFDCHNINDVERIMERYVIQK